MGVRRILAGSLSAPLLLLSACGGGDDSIADPPVSSAPTPTAPTHAPQQESAEHFIRRWFDIGTHMQNSGKTERYRALQDGCRDCAAVADRVERTYRAGGYYTTKGVRRLQVTSDKGRDNNRVIEIEVDLFPTTYVQRSGGSVQHFHGGPAHFQVGLESTDGSWLVTSLVQVAS